MHIDVDPTGALPTTDRLIAVDLDAASIARAHPNIDHERQVAIYDLLEENRFAVNGRKDGPYRLLLGIVEDRLSFAVSPAEKPGEPYTFVLSLTPFRRVVKDYILICDSYYQAIKTAPPSRIQAIDMGRRGLHDEGSRLLTERLEGKITLDHDTSRRLFTLIVALHWKG
ncbi:MAG: hypothetical protein RL291_1592 [Pseudomonadota bacterium]